MSFSVTDPFLTTFNSLGKLGKTLRKKGKEGSEKSYESLQGVGMNFPKKRTNDVKEVDLTVWCFG